MLDNIRRKRSQISDTLYIGVLPRLYAFSPSVSTLNLGNLRLGSQAHKSFRYFGQRGPVSYELCAVRGVEFKMIECPAGSFTMGHRDVDNNQPRTEVIESPFLLGQTEVAKGLYQAVMDTNPSGMKNSLQHPVEWVHWEDAILFCNKLSELQGLDLCYTRKAKKKYDWLCDSKKNGYRLPREKEWEYAAKAGTENQWAGTDNADELGEYAVYSNSSTEPVGSKAPNEWGFYDMSGNVWEWCWDKCAPKDSKLTADRVNRGGSKGFYDALYLRSALRNGDSPGTRSFSLGFRVCRTLV